MVKCWVSDSTPAHFYALFNKTIAVKPLIGTDEWTFKKTELENLNDIGKKYAGSIEAKLASRGLEDETHRVVCYHIDYDGNKVIRDIKLISFKGKYKHYTLLLISVYS